MFKKSTKPENKQSQCLSILRAVSVFETVSDVMKSNTNVVIT